MKITYVAAEAFPYAKTRSLAVTVHEQDELSKFKLDTGTGFFLEDLIVQTLFNCVSHSISNYHNKKV